MPALSSNASGTFLGDAILYYRCYNEINRLLRNTLTESIVYTAETVSKRKLSPKEALERRNSVCCVYNYKNYIVSHLLNITYIVTNYNSFAGR